MNINVPLQSRSRTLTRDKAFESALTLVLGALLALLALELTMSLSWRLEHDTAHLHYLARLIDGGLVPYRDIFETTLPLPLLIHLTIGRFLGYGDLAFRVVDVAWLVTLLALSARLLRPLGKRVVVAAVAIFGIVYLSFGPTMSFQRDYLGLLPIIAALLVARGKGHPIARAFVIGALFGLAVSIKPHLVIGLPVILVYAFPVELSRRTFHGLARVFLSSAAGLAAVVALPVLWVWLTGGLPEWWQMLTRYLPLYIQMNGMHKILTGLDRLLYLFTSYQELGGRGALLIPASLGIYIALFESRLGSAEKRLVGALVALMVLYGLYPVLTGQFWSYHWMPFIFFATICGALVLVEPARRERITARRWLSLAVFVYGLTLVIRPAPDFFRQIGGQEPRPPKHGRVDEMATFLRRELQPGDTVQPLDWIGGGTAQAMHLAGALPATRFVYDAQFYHHLSSDYIQGLRREFMDNLQAAPPRFFIDIPEQSRPTGSDTADSFPALEQFIHRNYASVQQGDGYVIYERLR